MSNIVKMMTGPQPRNFNPRAEVTTAAEILNAVRSKIVSAGARCIPELEDSATRLVKVIRGLNADHDFGVPDLEDVEKKNAVLHAQVKLLTSENLELRALLDKALTPPTNTTTVDVEVVNEEPVKRRGGRRPKTTETEAQE